MTEIIANGIIILVVALLIGGAVRYIVKAKKSGVKCIGCPMSGKCAHSAQNGGAGCNCHSHAMDSTEQTNQ